MTKKLFEFLEKQPQNAAAGDITFVFEVSSDLQNWTPVEFTEWAGVNRAVYEISDNDADYLWGRVRVSLP